ncbi:MAG: ABC transporter ATP-binding protein/permease [Defluviitaleaceae bacterium]|nr:ABC transporter ATP-binding protein/permease [Defluviitaleaceae bacterium]
MARNTFRTDEVLNEQNVFKLGHLKRLDKYIKPYSKKFTVTLGFTVVSGTLGLLAPYLTMIVMDESIPNRDVWQVVRLSGLMFLAVLVNIYFMRYRMDAMAKVGQGIIRDLRLDVFAHLQRLPFAYFDSRPHGKILVRVVNYINSLSDMLSNGLMNLITDLLSLVIIIAIMLSIDTYLTLVALAGMPLLIIAVFFIRIVNRKAWQIFSAKQSNMNAYIHESIAGVKITQSFSREAKNAEIFAHVTGEVKKAWNHGVRVQFLMWPSIENISILGVAFLYIVGVSLIARETLTVGVLIAFVAYIWRFWMPINNIAAFYNTLVTNMSYLELIFETLDEPVMVKDRPGAIPMPVIKGKVECKNIGFGYEEGQPVLKNVNFQCNAGDTIALVGPTGAGKTTVVNLISRFYELNEGQVLIDDVDISGVTLASLRCQMGIMLQDSFLFSGTIMDNIRYSRLDATDDEVIEAAKSVCAHDFIMETEKGYQTEVNERGSRLSLGQRQLISFARALLADPRILILDEATSNIDTKTEKALQEGLNRLLENRTSFIIAHRLSTIKHADKILVVDKGSIAESGSHDELMALRGDYYHLVVSQWEE